MESSTTSRFVRGWRSERTGSFVALYRHLSPRLAAWAEIQIPRELRGILVPAELVQTVWIEVWRDFGRYDPARGSFRSWLFGIAYNVLRNELRGWHRRERRTETIETLSGLVDVDATSVVGRVSREVDLDGLRAVLAQLDETDRQIVAYRGLERLPHAEVARRVGLGVAAVEARWRRLRPRLLKLVRRMGLS